MSSEPPPSCSSAAPALAPPESAVPSAVLLPAPAEAEAASSTGAPVDSSVRLAAPWEVKRVSRKRGRRKALPKIPNPEHASSFEFKSLGHFQSMFRGKFGTPRQGGLVSPSSSRAKLTLRPEYGATCLEGLEQYSHVWLVWVFHGNKVRERLGVPLFTKVKPPRLAGAKVGVFACRSPHRPNPVGLSLVRLDRVVGRTLWFSGVDLVEGTPIIDIKPHHPLDHCDQLVPQQDLLTGIPSVATVAANQASGAGCRHPEWVDPSRPLQVEFADHAQAQLREIFLCAAGLLQPPAEQDAQASVPQQPPEQPAGVPLSSEESAPEQQPHEEPPTPETPEFLFLQSEEEAILAIREVLAFDPRSTYSKKKQRGFVYGVYLDKLEVAFRYKTAASDEDEEKQQPQEDPQTPPPEPCRMHPVEVIQTLESKRPLIEVCWVEYHPEVDAGDLPPLRTKSWNDQIRAKLRTVEGE